MRVLGVGDVGNATGNDARLLGTTEELLGGRIDDLAKYRVVLHLLQHPWAMADSSHYASTLGFHSVARTTALLEELCEAGLLHKEVGENAETLYGLPTDSKLRWQLRKECLAKRAAPDYEVLIKRLAWRSVARVKNAPKNGVKAS